ncbi:uncharacterized protein LOC110367769 isoform X13 [Fundulus heteroclitus]|nr:uncharacterized protein LOC110367769 isoform X13 [Fundulus heteroclitus]
MMENHEMKIEVKEENHEVKIDVNVENHDMKTEEKENHEMKTEEKESHDMKTEEKESHEMKTEEENHEMKTEIKTEETQEIKMEVEDHHEMKIEVKEEEYEEVKVEKHQDQEADLHPLNTNRTDPASSSGPSDLQEHEDRQLTGGVESSYDQGGEALKVTVAPGSCIYQPYMFEPESDPECVEVEPLKGPARKKRAVSEWCACGNCGAMPTEAEHLCCLEIEQVTGRLQQEEQTPGCITEHPGFQPVCLNVYSLQNAYNIYRADYGALRLRGKEQ